MRNPRKFVVYYNKDTHSWVVRLTDRTITTKRLSINVPLQGVLQATYPQAVLMGKGYVLERGAGVEIN